MHIEQELIARMHRELFQTERPPDAYSAILLPHTPAIQALVGKYRHAFTTLDARQRSTYEQEMTLVASWIFYAVHRLHDVLLRAFSPDPIPGAFGEYGPGTWTGPDIAYADHVRWFEAIGFTRFAQPAFHPFYHEIVGVEQSADPDEPPVIVETLWDGWMIDAMLFARADARTHPLPLIRAAR